MQIDALTFGDLKKAKANKDATVAPIQAQIDAANARIAEIDAELTRDR